MCIRDSVGTVGQLDTYPGAVNIIPGEVHLSLDLRGELDEARDQVWQSISDAVDEITARRALSWSSREMHNAAAVFCAPGLQDVIAEGISNTLSPDRIRGGAPTLFSPAGHDAMTMAAITDVGMLFLRNPDGISHHPDEDVAEGDIAVGIRALAEAVLHLAAARG